MNLLGRNKRPSIHVTSHPNVDGYFSKKSTYSMLSTPTVLVTEEIWTTLERLNKMYNKQISRWKKLKKKVIICYPLFISSSFVLSARLPFVHFRGKDLQNSYLFRMYCNGFIVGYRYFFYDCLAFMTTSHAIKTQIELFLGSMVQSLEIEPNEATEDIDLFGEYCFDLGQKAAADYFKARFSLKDRKLDNEATFRSILRSNKGDEYLDKLVKVSVEYIKGDGKKEAKRTAVLFTFLQDNRDITLDYPNDKNVAFYNGKVIKLLWQQLGLSVKEDSYIKMVQKYYTSADNGYKVDVDDVKRFEDLLVENNLL